MSSIDMFTTPFAAPWAPPSRTLTAIEGLLGRSVTVTLTHRTELPAAWAADHPASPLPALPPYTFRAWANADIGRATLLVDETETPASVVWVLRHELAHLELVGAP